MALSRAEQFERQVDRTGEHHRWLGATNPLRGTGRLKVDGRQITAHRHAWELAHGPLPSGSRVIACPGDPSCVRLEHLQLDAKGRESPPGRRDRGTRGSGSKRQRASGQWELGVISGTDERGRAVRSFRTFRGNEPEANRALALFVAEIAEAGPVIWETNGVLTVEKLIDDFRLHLEMDKGRQPGTLLRYQGLQQKWINPYIGDKRADRILPSDIDSILGRLRRAGHMRSAQIEFSWCQVGRPGGTHRRAASVRPTHELTFLATNGHSAATRRVNKEKP